MSLIEHLEKPRWKEFLRSTFEFVLWVLRNDRFRSVGSAADDLRSWLAAGGVARVRHHLDEQIGTPSFTRRRESRPSEPASGSSCGRTAGALLDLSRAGIVPTVDPGHLPGVSVADVEDLLGRMLAGERPFEEWMHAHGHSDEEIAEIYRMVDRWLMKTGTVQ